MRRTAVLVVSIASVLGCPTEKWLLPGGVIDGGQDATGSGATGGKGGTGGTAGRGGPGSGGTGRPPCGDKMRITIEPIRTADLVFSIARNVSMATSFGNGTRMSAVQQAVRSVVIDNQYAVNFGYQDFPSAASCFNGTACCSNSEIVFPNQGTYGAIDQAMRKCDNAAPRDGCTSASDSRPIAEALGAINPPPPRFPILGPYVMIDRELVLIVDGAPGCNSQDPVQACEAALMQVSLLKNAHINTYVIPIGEEAEASDCLRRMALQAGTGTSYPARDPAQLNQSVNQIVSRAAAASCVITLLSTVPADSKQVELNIHNGKVPYDASGQNGWNFIAGSQGKIEVHGSWCDELQQGQDDIEVWAICPQ